MKQKARVSLGLEGFLLLLKGTLSSIPFNILAAGLLCIDLVYNKVPARLVCFWFCGIFVLCSGRWVYNKILLAKKYYKSHFNLVRFLFVFFISLTGLAWGAAYFLFLPYVNVTQQSLIVLVLGGLSAGGIGALSAYLPAYYAYVLSMFLPIIIYNFYFLKPDMVLTGGLYCLFIIMIFITAKINSQLLCITFNLGKEKDVLINQLTLMNLKLEKSIAEVRAMSITDSLTGLYNRRYFDMIFHNELRRAHSNRFTLNLVLIDIDNFKYVNDNYGHPTGDDFLIYVANALKNSVQQTKDTLFRLGGDEFAVILSHMLPEDVLLFCDALQRRFSDNNQYQNVTLSMGIISIASFKALDMQAVITAADRTLYQAKKDGKNKIIAKILD